MLLGLMRDLDKVCSTTRRRGSTVKAGTGGGSTSMGYLPQRRGRSTISKVQPHSSSIHVRSR
jgi:hypothetical protein